MVTSICQTGNLLSNVLVMDPYFIHRHKIDAETLSDCGLNRPNFALKWSRANAFLVDCEQSRHPSFTELSHAQMRRLTQKESKYRCHRKVRH